MSEIEFEGAETSGDDSSNDSFKESITRAREELSELLNFQYLSDALMRAAQDFDSKDDSSDPNAVVESQEADAPSPPRPATATDVIGALLGLQPVRSFFTKAESTLQERLSLLRPGEKAALYTTAATILLPAAYFQSPIQDPVKSFLNSQLTGAIHSLEPRLSPLNLQLSFTQKESRFMLTFDLAAFLRKYGL